MLNYAQLIREAADKGSSRYPKGRDLDEANRMIACLSGDVRALRAALFTAVGVIVALGAIIIIQMNI